METTIKEFKWEVQYKGQSVGKNFFTKKEAVKEWNRLWNLNLYGYTVSKIKSAISSAIGE
nr:hypothetical protein [uncultured Allomuricauda sp.]